MATCIRLKIELLKQSLCLFIFTGWAAATKISNLSSLIFWPFQTSSISSCWQTFNPPPPLRSNLWLANVPVSQGWEDAIGATVVAKHNVFPFKNVATRLKKDKRTKSTTITKPSNVKEPILTQFSTTSTNKFNWVIFTVPFSPVSPLLSEVVLAASDMVVSGKLDGSHKSLVSAKRAPVCLHTFRRALVQITSLLAAVISGQNELKRSRGLFSVPLLIWKHQPRAVRPPPARAGLSRHHPDDKQKRRKSNYATRQRHSRQ